MTAPGRIAVEQGSQAWLDARRQLVTATDLGVLLGINPWRCEADLADEKLHGTQQEPSLRMRAGNAMEPLIREAYQEQTGRRLLRYHGLLTHPDYPWAAASPDYRVVGEPGLMEAKYSTSRARFADGLPQEIQAQAIWQAAITGAEWVDVAVFLVDELVVTRVAADPALFADLLLVAEDFRRRLVSGGPFVRDAARVRRDHPADDGSEIAADNDVAEAVRALLDTRASRKRLEEDEERLETAIKARMADAAAMTGPGWRITWKRTKDRDETDWKAVAASLLATLSETDRATAVAPHTVVRPGFRPFRVTLDKETE